MWVLLHVTLLAAEPGYAPAGACTPCHAQIAESFSHTGMGRSISTPAPVEDWEVRNEFRHALSDRTFRMFRRAGEYFFLRYQTGPDGERIHSVEKRIDYVLGSGNHARTYLHRTPSGRLLGLPVAWYSANGGYWAMAPGYDRPDHVDYRREINGSCRFCHTSYPTSLTGPPLPIDCQRCHGAGAAHAAAPTRTNILNPSRLPLDRQLDICLQCHLQSTSQAAWMELRPGRSTFSFRPGEALAEFATHNLRPNPAFEVNHAGYRLLQSACYRKSNGALTCVTCHNPHTREVKPACGSCHNNPKHTGDCAACHMPKRTAEDAIHTVMTDHWILRRPAKRPTVRREARSDAPVPLTTPAALLNTLGESQYRAGQIAQAIQTLRQSIAENPDLPEAHINLGVALTAEGRRQEAEAAFREAIRIAPEYVAAHRNLAILLEARGDAKWAAYHWKKSGGRR